MALPSVSDDDGSDDDNAIINQYQIATNATNAPTTQTAAKYKTTAARRTTNKEATARYRAKTLDLAYEPSPQHQENRRPHSETTFNIHDQTIALREFNLRSESVSEQIERIFDVDIQRVINNNGDYDGYFVRDDPNAATINYSYIKVAKLIPILHLAQTNPRAAIGAFVDYVNYLGETVEPDGIKKTAGLEHLNSRHQFHLTSEGSKCDKALKNQKQPMLTIDTTVKASVSKLLETLTIWMAKSIEPKREPLWNEQSTSDAKAANNASNTDFEAAIALIYRTITSSPVAELWRGGQVVKRQQLLQVQVDRPIVLEKRCRLEIVKKILEGSLKSDLQPGTITSVDIHDSFGFINCADPSNLLNGNLLKWHHNDGELKIQTLCLIDHYLGLKGMNGTNLSSAKSRVSEHDPSECQFQAH